MKNKNQLSLYSLILFLSLFLVQACKDKEETDLFPSDRLTGTWNVSETLEGDTSVAKYKADVTRKDNDYINITSKMSNPPSYHLTENTVKVNWTDKKLERPGTTVSGTIKNENDFTIEYAFGNLSGVYSVTQHYTR